MKRRRPTPAIISALTICVTACSSTIDVSPRVELILSETANETEGTSVHIEQAWLTTWSVTLQPCTLSENKHGLDGPNRTNIVVVETLGDGENFGAAAEFAPIPGRYCSVIIESLPADADAVGDAPDLQLGWSIRLSGFHQGAAFSVQSAASFTHEIPFERPVDLRVGDEWTLLLTRDVNAWLLGDVVWDDPDAVGRAALQDALTTTQVAMEQSAAGGETE